MNPANPDEALAQALRQTASHARLGAPPVEATVRRGQIARRRRYTAMVAVSAAVLVPTFALAVRPGHHSQPTTPAAIPQTAAGQVANAQVVSPGERIALPAGATMWLDGQGIHLATATSKGANISDANVLRVAGTKAGQVSAMAGGSASSTVWVGIYRGPASPGMKITMKLGDHALDAKVTSLAGTPGWCAFSAYAPNEGADAKPTVSIDAADGTRLLSTKL